MVMGTAVVPVAPGVGDADAVPLDLPANTAPAAVAPPASAANTTHLRGPRSTFGALFGAPFGTPFGALFGALFEAIADASAMY